MNFQNKNFLLIFQLINILNCVINSSIQATTLSSNLTTNSHSNSSKNKFLNVSEENSILKKYLNVSSESGPTLRLLDKKYSGCGKHNIDIREVTISQVEKYFASGELSSLELTLCYLKRIEMMNPILKAVIEVNPSATKLAIYADLQGLMGVKRSPLQGVPILIKDNIATVDLMQTTTGAVALEFVRPQVDADVVKKLRAAGAVIIGKTNPSEWANHRGDNEPSGWSGRGGQTLSPYLLSSNPSGSSTGSAVGIAANLAVVALGTETDGSIILPSSRGSIVGLKPTLGAVSTKGVIPISMSQDVVGPMARTTNDAAILMHIISNDGIGECGFYLKSCMNENKFRVGVPRLAFWNESDTLIANTIPLLLSSLITLNETRKVTVLDPIQSNKELQDNITDSAENTVYNHEFKYGVNKYLSEAKYIGNCNTRKIINLADVIKFNVENPPPKGYNQINLIAAQATDGLQNQTYKMLRDKNKKTAQEFLQNILDENKLDAMVGPCDSESGWLMHSYGAIAGFPFITVPSGLQNGKPIGICFLARPNSESVLLKIAFLLENIEPMRQMPVFKS